MSLLLKALKQAEEQKKLREAAEREVEEPFPELSLDDDRQADEQKPATPPELEFESCDEDVVHLEPSAVHPEMHLQIEPLDEVALPAEIDMVRESADAVATIEPSLSVPEPASEEASEERVTVAAPLSAPEIVNPVVGGHSPAAAAVKIVEPARLAEPVSAHALNVASTILKTKPMNKRPGAGFPLLLLGGSALIFACLGWLYWEWSGIQPIAPLDLSAGARPPSAAMAASTPLAGAVHEGASSAAGREAEVTAVSGKGEGVALTAPQLPVKQETAAPVVQRQPADPAGGVLPRFERQQSDAKEDTNLLVAWQAYQDGKTDLAKSMYSRVLQQDARSRDAMLGMAAISLRAGQVPEAVQWYRRIVQAYPQDATATAALTALQGRDMDAATVTRLQQEGRPENTLILAQYFSSQQRWAEAQEQYFQAWSREPGNPVLAFNLAVCLDQLNQSKLAREYYLKAIELLPNGSALFDRAGAQQRVAELEAQSR